MQIDHFSWIIFYIIVHCLGGSCNNPCYSKVGSYKLLQGESFFPPGVHKTRPTKKKHWWSGKLHRIWWPIGSGSIDSWLPSHPHPGPLESGLLSWGRVVGWLVGCTKLRCFLGGEKNIHEILRVIMQSSMTHQDGGFRNDILSGKIQAKELTQHIFPIIYECTVHLSIVLDQPSPRTFDIPRLLLRLKDLGVTTN